ncbi:MULTISPECIES: hypothetical protein [Paenibacillaceae]|uniref:hypothetical protein n=1 Tax=Paenibacillaceae TaxID=186822 RepID=UPI002FDF626D
MNLNKYIMTVNLAEKTELEKVQLLAFFLNITEKTTSFALDNIVQMLKEIGHPISNVSRIKSYLSKSKDFKKIGKGTEYMITPTIKQKLQDEIGPIFNNIEEVISSSEILDEALFLGKRGFIDKLIKQINSSYKNNCYDACAVLMRRVFEVSLILAYESKGIQDQIKDGHGDYVMLERIVANAIQNRTLNISRSRKEYDSIRDLGNFAAHKIHFNTRKSDIDDIKQTYRVCLEELFYIAGLIH